MKLRRSKSHGVPSLNTAALPDLIFTVLFFFMIVTHMRSTDVKVRYEVPEGTEMKKMTQKSAVTCLYVGQNADGETVLQVNNDIVPLAEIAEAIAMAKKKIPAEDMERHTVCLKADKHTPLSVIAEIKDAFKRAGVTRVTYSANERENNNENKN